MGSQPLGAVRGVTAAGRRVLLLALLALGAAAPLLLLLLTSIAGRWLYPDLLPEHATLESWRSLLEGGRLAGAAGTSLALAVGTASLAVLLGLPLGRALARLTGWR